MKVQNDLALDKVLFSILPSANNLNNSEDTQLTTSRLYVNLHPRL